MSLDYDKIKLKVEAKNKLEGYCFSIKNTMLDDEKMKGALGENASTVEQTIKDAQSWLEEEHTVEEYEIKQKEVEGVLMPLVQKAYAANLPKNEDGTTPDMSNMFSGMPGGVPPTGVPPTGVPPTGETTEEVD